MDDVATELSFFKILFLLCIIIAGIAYTYSTFYQVYHIHTFSILLGNFNQTLYENVDSIR